MASSSTTTTTPTAIQDQPSLVPKSIQEDEEYQSQYDKFYSLPNGHASGVYKRGSGKGNPLIVVIPGAGCNSKYMDRPGYSYVEDAATFGRGSSILILNRPGYGGTRTTDALDTIEASIEHLIALINMVWEEEREQIDAPGVVVIGHSVGGATAYTLAAEETHPFPLLGVAVSGFSKTHSGHTKYDPKLRGSRLPPPPPGAVTLFDKMFGPPGTYEPAAKLLSLQGHEPPVYDELLEISQVWPGRFENVAGRIRCPVWHGLAEHDVLWRVGQEVFDKMRPAYTACERVELVELVDGGHAYSFHKKGKEMHRMQFEFALSCVPLVES